MKRIGILIFLLSLAVLGGGYMAGVRTSAEYEERQDQATAAEVGVAIGLLLYVLGKTSDRDR